MDDKIVGHVVKRLRIKNKKTVDEIARAIGISQSYLTRIENNTQIPSLKIVDKIANYFDVHRSYLFFDNKESINIEDVKQLNIIFEDGSRVTEEELEIVIKHLKTLKEFKDQYLNG
ncbi:helix-turn-helix transcriptional regulator [Bacillus subtilis]|uniref:helix-turn-helix domain-containing protein n=1 Tax=Bacillus subtilis TaxID=1423 RepID=UPI002ED1C8FE